MDAHTIVGTVYCEYTGVCNLCRDGGNEEVIGELMKGK